MLDLALTILAGITNQGLDCDVIDIWILGSVTMDPIAVATVTFSSATAFT